MIVQIRKKINRRAQLKLSDAFIDLKAFMQYTKGKKTFSANTNFLRSMKDIMEIN